MKKFTIKLLLSFIILFLLFYIYKTIIFHTNAIDNIDISTKIILRDINNTLQQYSDIKSSEEINIIKDLDEDMLDIGYLVKSIEILNRTAEFDKDNEYINKMNSLVSSIYKANSLEKKIKLIENLKNIISKLESKLL
ncbi:hypothetical protein [Dethiothermospora halolimnae]|uniref:hypothetical protein n=1 Tax=Dethiothermospora halolimnae TaxID=3114390 RepID=UPI003CCBB067